MLFVCDPQILHKHCFQFLVGVKMAPKETKKKNAYAKFWVHNKEHYRMLRCFLEWSNNCSVAKNLFAMCRSTFEMGAA